MIGHNLIELDAVMAVARRKSFRAAAVELQISTTALSNLIAKFEKQLGVRLFNRTTRSVSLTDAGRNFVEEIGPALVEIHSAMDSAMSQQEVPSGTIRINAFPTAAREILEPVILEYLRRYPQVHIDLVTEGRLLDVVADGFDLGVRSADLVPDDMIAVPIGKARFYVVVASPAYLEMQGKPRVPLDLLNHACIRIRLPNGGIYKWHFEKDGQPIQVDVKGPITLDEASLSRTAALRGIGLGLFMESDVREEIEAGRLIKVLDDWIKPVAPLCLYYPGRKNPSAAFKAFINLARDFTTASNADPGPRRG
ncbi:LysR family transcriptional regulator [Bosea rubneri]|uniref:LysR family transcriptional regulator n=1 Tax=Bosea rubneri TaxID=3075434 RepID=A0ABU3SG30_9HYPH|nr:LysR family transcriptional regulator [Bosea sp. ZW T0_25]MDU0343631.1 LysR family transcriptional regulator [Bosea sp. ZW T0_25]